MKTDFKLPLQVIEKSAELGYTPESLPLLLLVPFVQVAWAEGFVQTGEQKAILRFAENFSVKPGHTGYEQLLLWFDERPTDEFFTASIEDLRALLESLSDKQAARLRSMLQFGCVEVAHATGEIGFLRGRSNIQREEREHLQHIGERLGLTHTYV
jgi:hypothetical protein